MRRFIVPPVSEGAAGHTPDQPRQTPPAVELNEVKVNATTAMSAPTAVGNHPQDVPAYMANLWTTHEFAIDGVSGFHVGGGVNYMSRVYSDITNVNSAPAYVIANAAFGYRAHHWGVDLNVHNLTNRRYFVAANMAGAYVGEPLSAYVTLHADF